MELWVRLDHWKLHNTLLCCWPRLCTACANKASRAPPTPESVLLHSSHARRVLPAEALLRRSSLLDGTQRLQLSTNQLRFPIPQHDIEPGKHTTACQYVMHVWPLCSRIPHTAVGHCKVKHHMPAAQLSHLHSHMHTADLMTMDVYLRPDYGSNFCKWLRKVWARAGGRCSRV